MDTFNSARRELLKFSPFALAAAASPAMAFAAPKPSVVAASAMFDVRTFGATGDGKTVDTPAVNKALKRPRPPAAER